jgi:hypothetical protein
MLHNKDLALLGSRYSRGFELLAAFFALGGGGADELAESRAQPSPSEALEAELSLSLTRRLWKQDRGLRRRRQSRSNLPFTGGHMSSCLMN